MQPLTKLYTDWDTDPLLLATSAKDRIGMLYQPANEEIPVDCRIGSIMSFQIVPAPAHEGEGYYMFILYGLVYDDEP